MKMSEESSSHEANLKCISCGSNLLAENIYCPVCGTRTSLGIAAFAVSPDDPTAASFRSHILQHKPATNYSSPSEGVSLYAANPYEAAGPPPSPPRRPMKFRFLVGFLSGILVALLLIVSVGAFVLLIQGAINPRPNVDKLPIPPVHCTSAGQFCTPPFETTIRTNSLFQIEYIVPGEACASIRLHIFVDAKEVRVTEFLGWPGGPLPLSTGILDLGPVASGQHVLALEAEGKSSGCNRDFSSWSWGGTLLLSTS